jgi:hypothetical protein
MSLRSLHGLATGCAAIALFAAGCMPVGLYADGARARAAHTWNCPIDAVSARYIGDRDVYNVDLQGQERTPAFVVEGCDHIATYECRTKPSRSRDRRWGTDDVPACWVEGTLVQE